MCYSTKIQTFSPTKHTLSLNNHSFKKKKSEISSKEKSEESAGKDCMFALLSQWFKTSSLPRTEPQRTLKFAWTLAVCSLQGTIEL